MKENKLHVIAKIDKKKYGIEELNTNEVVITDERINHIKEHHHEVFEFVMEKMKDTVEEPDYVYDETLHEDTRWAIKLVNGENIRIVLKLSVGKKNSKFKNAVITAQLIPSHRIERHIKTNRIKMVYKK